MQLKLSVSSAQGASLGPDAVARFRLRGGTIGRARDNDWVLPDPERIVSGHHARILYEQGGYYIEDTSSNGTFLNGQDSPLPRGQPSALQHGDLLSIGDYEIRVELEEDSTNTASAWPDLSQPPEQPPEFVAKPYAPPASPYAAPAATDSRATEAPEPDPWAGRRYRESTQPPARDDWAGVQRDHLAPDAINFHPPSASPELIPSDGTSEAPDDILPDDWWKVDDDTPEGSDDVASTASTAPPNAAEPPAAVNLGAEPEPAIGFPQDRGERQSASLDLPSRIEAPPPDVRPPTSPPGLRSQPPHPPPQTERPRPSQEAAPPPGLPEAAVRETPREPESLQPPAPATTSEPVSSGSVPPTASVLEAYYEGLGLRAPPLTPEEAERELRQMGRLIRILTDGLMEVLKTRSTLKGEFRLSQTIVQSAENNPLKFCVDANQALSQLFVDRRPGFMAPEASFGEALTDIKQHQLAVVAGMRAAFDCLIAKFEPDTIEAARKAAGKRHGGLFADKQWAFYCQYHADFKANAGDDFQGIFGEDFVRAYEAQIRRLMSGSSEDS